MMISFACTKCGKRDSRPDGSAGSLVFCTCGQSNRVPWASEPPTHPTAPVPVPREQAPPRPRAVPVLDAEPASPRPAPRRLAPAPELKPTAVDGLASRRPGRLLGKVNPKFCYHHDDAPSETTCSACRLPFCAGCVVEQRGETLCGPCKNFRLAALGRPRRVLPLAIFALVVSLSGGPVALLLSLVGVGLYRGEGMALAALALCLIGAALPVIGLVLARMALRRIDERADAAGRSLATGGAAVCLAELVWCAGVAALVVRQSVL